VTVEDDFTACKIIFEEGRVKSIQKMEQINVKGFFLLASYPRQV
jgi:hypothetical protein